MAPNPLRTPNVVTYRREPHALSLGVCLIVKTTIASRPRAAHCCSTRSSAAPSSAARSLARSHRRDSTLLYKNTPPCATALAIPSPRPSAESAGSSSFFGCVRTLFTRVPDTKTHGRGEKTARGAGENGRRYVLPTHMYTRGDGDEGDRELEFVRRSDSFSLGFRSLGRVRCCPDDFLTAGLYENIYLFSTVLSSRGRRNFQGA